MERREGLSRADLFELGLYTPPKATPSRCQPRIDEARMKEVAKGIQKAFFLEGKESERIARRWLLNGYKRKGRVKPFNPEAWEDGRKSASLSPIGPGGGIGTLSGGSGCQCSSCRFLYSQPCTHIPCVTPCFDDPDMFCLYCLGSDGSITEIGRYSTVEAWQAALEAQVAACGCGSGGQNVDDCGTIYWYFTGYSVTVWALCCCDLYNGEPCCYQETTGYEISCNLVCGTRECPAGKNCYIIPQTGAHSCDTYMFFPFVNCEPCCKRKDMFCPRETGCPSGFYNDGNCHCTNGSEYIGGRTINYVCNCQ